MNYTLNRNIHLYNRERGTVNKTAKFPANRSQAHLKRLNHIHTVADESQAHKNHHITIAQSHNKLTENAAQSQKGKM